VQTFGDLVTFNPHVHALVVDGVFLPIGTFAGTRAGRFMLQDVLGNFVPPLKRTEAWGAQPDRDGGLRRTVGWFLYQGVTDPLGGINMLWPLFGVMQQVMISNYSNAALTAVFMFVVFAVLLYSIKAIVRARSVGDRTRIARLPT
jgi:carbon starvation protein CstA